MIIPPAVYIEVVMRGRGRPGDAEVRRALQVGWMRMSEPNRLIQPPYRGMHRGEVEALSLAAELKVDGLFDEQLARVRAEKEGIFCFTTLDVLRLAKLSGQLPALRSSLDALRATGFRMDDEVLRKAKEL